VGVRFESLGEGFVGGREVGCGSFGLEVDG
jgi:hypothetical protein